ncbi:hypothetical protein WJX74_001775 [Apatococcus lobatus]|uniref:Sugar phosphate transporter domain-containing protein n=1 Tax=Apatococcus lobatus TaxID=904363 RepID=A0AAW1RLP9_9CHLO
MSDKGSSDKGGDQAVATQVLLNLVYVSVWIGLSGTVILYNKWILAFYGFPFPIALTMWHMGFSGLLAFACVRLGYVPSVNMSRETYMKAIVPIGALFAGTLWLGNAAYLYLSVSFIQMLKALMPVAVFIVGCGFKTETYSSETFGNMVIVTLGVAIASYGELNFHLLGVVLQLLSVCTESTRLTLVQILLQRRGLSLNPITTMYYIAPASFGFLCIPFLTLELREMMAATSIRVDPFVFLSNAAAAFGLNMAVFLLIGKTSALTMNIAGVVKDWLLIGLSVALFHSAVSGLNLFGYLIAFLGVCWYNYRKLQNMKRRQAGLPGKSQPQAAVLPSKSAAVGEEAPLLNVKGEA